MVLRFATAVAALLALAAPPASARQDPYPPPYTLAITVTPPSAEPGGTVRVTAPSPPARVVQYYGGEAGFFYDVFVTYTTTTGSTGKVVRRNIAGTRIDVTFAVPDDAKGGTTATVRAALRYVTPGGGALVGEDTAALAITFPMGSLSVAGAVVPAGGALVVTGGACHAATYAVRYRSGTGPWSVVAEGTPAADGTFRARVAASALRPGAGEVTAVCAGTSYRTIAVRVLAAAAPPRAPVPLLPRTGPATGLLALAGCLLVATGTLCLTVRARRTGAAPARAGLPPTATRP